MNRTRLLLLAASLAVFALSACSSSNPFQPNATPTRRATPHATRTRQANPTAVPLGPELVSTVTPVPTATVPLTLATPTPIPQSTPVIAVAATPGYAPPVQTVVPSATPTSAVAVPQFEGIIVGAVCHDETTTNRTDEHACDGHKGVKQWIYQ